MDNKQLYEKQSNQYNPFFPIVRLEDIIDKITEKSIQWILNNYNHIYVEYSESREITRNKVPQMLRRSGLWISYNNGKKNITEYYIGENTDVNNYVEWTLDDNWKEFDELTIQDKSITYQHLSDALRELVAGGNTITNFPDEEDITTDGTVLSFKDRDYDPNVFSGLGRKILRKNIVNGVNTLTQNMMQTTNTIYVIQYDFILDENITVPANCVLEFNGGSISYGSIDLNSCKLINVLNTPIFNGISLTNPKEKITVKASWFEDINNIATINMLKAVFNAIDFSGVNIELTKPIVIETTDAIKELYGCEGSYTRNSRVLTTITANGCEAFVIKKAGTKIHNFCIVGIGCGGTYNSTTQIFDNAFDGIRIEAYNQIIENISIINFGTGIRFYDGHITSCNISKILISSFTNYGVYMAHHNNSGNKNNNKLYDLYIVDGGLTPMQHDAASTKMNSGVGLYVKGGYENIFEGIVCERNSGTGVLIEAVNNHYCKGSGFKNIYLEHNRYANLLINTAEPYMFTGNTVKDIFSTYYNDVAPDKCRVAVGFINAEAALDHPNIPYINNIIEFVNPYKQLLDNTFAICDIDYWYPNLLIGVDENSLTQFEKHGDYIWQLFDNTNKNSIYNYLIRGRFKKGYYRIPLKFDRISLSTDVQLKFNIQVGDILTKTYSDKAFIINLPAGTGAYSTVIEIDVPEDTWVRFTQFRLGNNLNGSDKFYMRINRPVNRKNYSDAFIKTIEGFNDYFDFGHVILNDTIKEILTLYRDKWIDAFGFTATSHRGTSDLRPNRIIYKNPDNPDNYTYAEDETHTVRGFEDNLQRDDVGFDYYDTTLKKILYLQNIHPTSHEATWIEFDGARVNVSRSGTWVQRPTYATHIYEGFMYMINDGTNHFPIYAHINDSSIEWYKADGTQYIGS